MNIYLLNVGANEIDSILFYYLFNLWVTKLYITNICNIVMHIWLSLGTNSLENEKGSGYLEWGPHGYSIFRDTNERPLRTRQGGDRNLIPHWEDTD